MHRCGERAAWAENTHFLSKGKYHWTAYLLLYFVLIQLLCLYGNNKRFTCLVKSKLVKQEVSRTVILPHIK